MKCPECNEKMELKSEGFFWAVWYCAKCKKNWKEVDHWS